MLQDIAPYSFCNDFAWINPEPTDRVLVYRGSTVLVSIDTAPQNVSEDAREGTLRFPTYKMRYRCCGFRFRRSNSAS